jgi:uncharacterized protein (TIGR02246 family)
MTLPRHSCNRGTAVSAVLLLLLTGTLPTEAGRRCRILPPSAPVVTVPPLAAPAPAPATPAEDTEAAIRKVLADQVTAWNRGDLERFMEGYWKSPDLTFSSGGDQARGWQATLDRYRQRYQGEGREMGRLTFSDITVTLLGPDSAFVRGRWQLERRKDRPGGIYTLVFRRFPEGWRVVHDHTSN